MWKHDSENKPNSGIMAWKDFGILEVQILIDFNPINPKPANRPIWG